MPTTLTTRDHRRIFGAMTVLYAAPDEETMLRAAAQEVYELVCCDSVSVAAVTRKPPRMFGLVHPTGQRASALLVDLAGRCTWQQMAPSPTVVRPVGGGHQLVVPILTEAGGGTCLGITREADGFDERDRAVALLLQPHLVLAYQRAVAIESDAIVLPEQRPRPSTLTAREQEILCHASAGLSDAQIAARLVISVRTVQKHLENAYRKLGVANRTMAARLLV